MAQRDSTAMKVRLRKEKHPGEYCSVKDCLWKTPDRYCPKHFHLWSFIVNLPIRRDGGNANNSSD